MRSEMAPEQLAELQKLERRIFECGVDGGESTSEAIDDLVRREKELGVYDLNATCPRWNATREAMRSE